jgi:NADH-quinone oxidoreductase subunit M
MKMVPLILGILFGGAVLSYVLGKVHYVVKNVISFAVLAAAGYLFVIQYGAAETFSFSVAGFNLIWKLTPLSWFFGLMIFGLGILVQIYSSSFMKGKDRVGYFCFSLLITIASMVGIVVSADLLSFFFFWEIMTWSSFLMVIYYRFEAQKAGIKYFVMSAIGAYAMLLALFMIQAEVGSLSFTAIAAEWSGFGTGFQLGLIVLFVLAFGLKAALMPLHTWAPDAYGISPSPFTSLFSGVLSKMGIFGIIILFYVISAGSFTTQFITYNGTPLPGYILAWLGVLTALIATIIAVVQDDAKKLLAYSSIGQLGYIVMAISLGDSLGMTSGLFLAVNHTIFKGMLFLAIGAVFYRTGTKKMSDMGGLITRMPYTFFVVLLGIITLAGVPPLSGYVGKWMLYEALIQKKMVFLAVATFAASTIAFLYCYRLIFTIFLGQRPAHLDNVKEVPWAMRAPMLLLSLLTIYLGFYPYHLLDLIAAAEKSIPGINPFVFKDSVLFSQIGGVDTVTVMTIIGAAFVVIFVIFNTVYKRSRLVGLKDIHTAGEVPGPEINLHFAVNFYQPFSRGVQGVLKRSADRFYQSIADGLENLFDMMRYIYTGNGQTYAMYVIIFLVFLFVFGTILI